MYPLESHLLFARRKQSEKRGQYSLNYLAPGRSSRERTQFQEYPFVQPVYDRKDGTVSTLCSFQFRALQIPTQRESRCCHLLTE
jgi:hypothetical protein